MDNNLNQISNPQSHPNRTIFFCSTLQEAFARAGMNYPAKTWNANQFVRFSTDTDLHDQDGYCKLYNDHTGAVFGCMRTGIRAVWQQGDANAPILSKEERQKSLNRVLGLQQEADQMRALENSNAAAKAALLYEQARAPSTAHPYLVEKRIKPFQAHENEDGALIIPVYGPNFALQTIQTIDENGRKLFFRNGKAKNGRLYLGVPTDAQPLIVCEGWATGCSIHQATDLATVVCFSGSNMADVSADLREHFQNSPLLIAADLDVDGGGAKCANAAVDAGWPASMLLPSFQENCLKGDFNDLHQSEGLLAVRSQIAKALETMSSSISPLVVAGSPSPCQIQLKSELDSHKSMLMNDSGNAQRLLSSSQGRFKFVPEHGSWLAWVNGAWEWDSEGAIVRDFVRQELPQLIFNESEKNSDLKKELKSWGIKSGSAPSLKNAVSILRDVSEIRLESACLNADPFLVGFDQARQVLDLKAGKIRPALKEDYITKTLNISSIGDSTKAIRWIAFLNEIFEDDQDVISWIKKFLGYSLTGSTDEQVLVCAHGSGANGKSEMLKLIMLIFGDYAKPVSSETLTSSKRNPAGAAADLMDLVGARMGICHETDVRSTLNGTLVKSMASGDEMPIRNLYKGVERVIWSLKLLIATNHLPNLNDLSFGMTRRLRVLPFNRTFSPEQKDSTLSNTLRAEAPDILAWMVEGYKEWQEQGLKHVPEAMASATKSWTNEQDEVGLFVKECMVPDGKALGQSVYARFDFWSKARGIRYPMTIKPFYARLRALGFPTAPTKNGLIIEGLSLNPLNK